MLARFKGKWYRNRITRT